MGNTKRPSKRVVVALAGAHALAEHVPQDQAEPARLAHPGLVNPIDLALLIECIGAEELRRVREVVLDDASGDEHLATQPLVVELEHKPLVAGVLYVVRQLLVPHRAVRWGERRLPRLPLPLLLLPCLEAFQVFRSEFWKLRVRVRVRVFLLLLRCLELKRRPFGRWGLEASVKPERRWLGIDWWGRGGGSSHVGELGCRVGARGPCGGVRRATLWVVALYSNRLGGVSLHVL